MHFSDFALNINEKESTDLKRNINHSVARWCFNDIDWIPLYRSSKLGIKGIDLLALKNGLFLTNMV
jgi:hydroxypyruvate isomerase